jgi:hypothetical protein
MKESQSKQRSFHGDIGQITCKVVGMYDTGEYTVSALVGAFYRKGR